MAKKRLPRKRKKFLKKHIGIRNHHPLLWANLIWFNKSMKKFRSNGYSFIGVSRNANYNEKYDQKYCMRKYQ